MGNWKGFLTGYVVVYLVVSTTLNIVFGPPGMSKEYLSQYKSDYDRYIDIQKQDEYKLWSERPHLHGDDETLESDVKFVEAVEANPDFKAEEKRRHRYDLLFDFFNAGMLILLIVRFSRKPLAGLLDGMVAQVRDDLTKAESARSDSALELKNAEAKMGTLTIEESELAIQTRDRIKRAEEENRILNGQSLSVLNRETTDRMRHEEVLARQALKQELVENVIDELTEQARSGADLIHQDALLNQFVQRVEKPK